MSVATPALAMSISRHFGGIFGGIGEVRKPLELMRYLVRTYTSTQPTNTMTTQPDLLTTDPTPPPPLVAARLALAKADEELAEAQQLHDEQGPEATPVLDHARGQRAAAAAVVARLEMEAMNTKAQPSK